jgi:hypothetical protein
MKGHRRHPPKTSNPQRLVHCTGHRKNFAVAYFFRDSEGGANNTSPSASSALPGRHPRRNLDQPRRPEPTPP